MVGISECLAADEGTCTRTLGSAAQKKGDQTEVTSEIKEYLASRKAGHVSMLKEIEAVTLSVFESSLSFISRPRTPSNLSSFALVTKLISPQKNFMRGRQNRKVDSALSTVLGHKIINSDNNIYFQNQLKEMESSIQDLEEGLESLSRHLIKARVSLLNIF
ncbi:hypothetical protein KPL70_014670 [Citrus sinensis]|nr:hypothetical protein KPL70_014670 [Citrus sinensis]